MANLITEIFGRIWPLRKTELKANFFGPQKPESLKSDSKLNRSTSKSDSKLNSSTFGSLFLLLTNSHPKHSDTSQPNSTVVSSSASKVHQDKNQSPADGNKYQEEERPAQTAASGAEVGIEAVAEEPPQETQPIVEKPKKKGSYIIPYWVLQSLLGNRLNTIYSSTQRNEMNGNGVLCGSFDGPDGKPWIKLPGFDPKSIGLSNQLNLLPPNSPGRIMHTERCIMFPLPVVMEMLDGEKKLKRCIATPKRKEKTSTVKFNTPEMWEVDKALQKLEPFKNISPEKMTAEEYLKALKKALETYLRQQQKSRFSFFYSLSRNEDTKKLYKIVEEVGTFRDLAREIKEMQVVPKKQGPSIQRSCTWLASASMAIVLALTDLLNQGYFFFCSG